MLGVVRTAINHVIIEHSLNIPNVFTNLRIKGAGASKHDRLPLSDAQVLELETAYSNDEVAWALFVSLRDTGARISEVSGLRVKDCDLGQQCLHLIATPWRSLKTEPLSSHLGKHPVGDLSLSHGKEVLGYITRLSPNVRKYRDGKAAGLVDLASLSVENTTGAVCGLG